MAKGQGRSSEQGVKLLYIRDYLRQYADKEHPKSANDIMTPAVSGERKIGRKAMIAMSVAPSKGIAV